MNRATMEVMGAGSSAGGRVRAIEAASGRIARRWLPLLRRIPRRWRWVVGLSWVVLALVLAAGISYAFVVGKVSTTHDWPGVALYAAIGLGSGALAAARGLLVVRERAVWLLVSVAILLALTKDVAWYFGALARPYEVGPHHVLLMVLTIPGTAALAMLLRARFEIRSGMVVDMIAGALVLPAIFLGLMFTGAFGMTGLTTLQRIAWTVDPLAKILVVCVVMAAVAAIGWRRSRTWTLLLAGVTLSCLGDLLLSGKTLGSEAHSGIAVLWIVGLVLVALAAWQEASRTPEKPQLTRSALLAPLLFAGFALAVLIVDSPLEYPLVLSAVIAIGLVVAAVRAAAVHGELRRRGPRASSATAEHRTAVPPRVVEPTVTAVAGKELATFRLGLLTPATAKRAAAPASRPDLSALTPRERQVARLIAEGMLQKQAARALGVSHKTIEKHLASARRKLGLATTNQLIAHLHGGGRASGTFAGSGGHTEARRRPSLRA